MAFEPCRYVDQQGEAGGMRLWKTVTGESLDLAVDLIGELGAVAALRHAVEQPLLHMLQTAAAPPCRHRAAQLVGLARRETGRDDSELHDLLLKYRHAQGAAQHALDRFRRIGDRFGTLAPAQIGMHHAALSEHAPG